MPPRLILGPLLLLTLAGIARADNSRLSFPTFGLSCVQPANTTIQLTSEPGHVVLMRSPGANLLIEVQLQVDHTLDEFAGALASRNGIPIDNGTFSIGGERAVKIAGATPDGVFHSVFIIIHQGRGYLFNCVGRNSEANDQLLAAVLPTVRLESPDAPSQHVDAFFPRPLTIFNEMTMNVPSCLRTYRRDEHAVMLGAHDFLNSADPFFINIQTINLPNTRRFSDIYDSLGPILQQKLHLDEVPSWRPHPSVPNLFVSQFVGQPDPANPERRLLTRYAALDLGAGHYIQLVFTVQDDKELDIQAYRDATDRILESVSVVAHAAADSQ
ncbi:MAG TPA: hypothetical protein VM008_08995 [Phycisphaerae bacterium]|nr:hypothetical protein [Phycisphaerae bacterium]